MGVFVTGLRYAAIGFGAGFFALTCHRGIVLGKEQAAEK